MPSLRSGIDWTRVSLTPEEAFAASRVDGATSVEGLAAVLGRSKPDTLALVQSLADKGVVELKAPAGAPRPRRSIEPPMGKPLEPPRPAAAPRPPSRSSAPKAEAPKPDLAARLFDMTGFEFPPMEGEEVDLELEVRRKIRFAKAKLDEWTHYELLQLERSADPKAIKKAYFERSKEWHPDRFRKPRLGPYKPMLEAIFRRVGQAYKTLSNEAERAEYDRTLPAPPPEPPPIDQAGIDDLLRREHEEARAAKRVAEAKARRLKKNPMVQRLKQAKDWLGEAKTLEAEGKTREALRIAQLAVSYDEHNDEAKALVLALSTTIEVAKAEPLMKTGAAHEFHGQIAEAAEAYVQATRHDPSNGRAHLKAVECLLALGKVSSETVAHAQRAAALMPTDAEAAFVLGRCYEATANEGLAKKAFERALGLDPNHEEAKKRLNRHKWGF